MLGILVLPAGMEKVRFQNSKPLDSHDQLQGPESEWVFSCTY